MSEREDGSFARNAKNLFNLVILHDPLINKIILKMQEKIVRDTDPDNEESGNGELTPWHEYGDPLSEKKTSKTNVLLESNPHQNAGSCKHLSDAELMQQVIHEDIKRIIEEMRTFRCQFYDNLLTPQNNKAVIGAKSALQRRWVVFYQNMLNLGIFSLDIQETPKL